MNEYISKLIDGNFRFQKYLLDEEKEIPEAENLPRYPVLILTCMDPEVEVYKIFNLELGDVMVMRNAGNMFTDDILRSILIAIHKKKIENIIVLGHTNCALGDVDVNKLKMDLWQSALAYICKKGLSVNFQLYKFFQLFADEIQNVKKQVDKIQSFEGFPTNLQVSGMLYDSETGWVFGPHTVSQLEDLTRYRTEFKNLVFNKHQLFISGLEDEKVEDNAPLNPSVSEISVSSIKEHSHQESENRNRPQANEREKFSSRGIPSLKENAGGSNNVGDLMADSSEVIPMMRDIISKNMASIKVPKVPKISIPKIKVYIPKKDKK